MHDIWWNKIAVAGRLTPGFSINGYVENTAFDIGHLRMIMLVTLDSFLQLIKNLSSIMMVVYVLSLHQMQFLVFQIMITEM